MNKQYLAGFITAVISSLIFGSAAIFVRFADKMDALFISASRLTIGAGLLLLFFGFAKSKVNFVKRNPEFASIRTKSTKLKKKQILALSLLSSVHFFTFVLAVQNGTVLRVVLIVNTAPIIVLIINSAFERQFPTFVEAFAIALTVIGIFILETQGDFAKLFAVEAVQISDLLALVCATAYALYIVYASALRKKHSSLQIMSSFFIGGSALLWIAILIKDFALPFFCPAQFSENFSFQATLFSPNIWAVFALGLLPTGLGHFLYNVSLKTVPVLTAGAIAVLEPITAGFYAFVFFSESLTPIELSGIAVALLGLTIISVKKKPEIEKR